MRITQITVNKTFEVQHNGRTYWVDYLNSDGQILGLLNRDNLEVTGEDGESFSDYVLASMSDKEKAEADERSKIVRKLIRHVIEHFNDLDEELTDDFEEYREGVV